MPKLCILREGKSWGRGWCGSSLGFLPGSGKSRVFVALFWPWSKAKSRVTRVRIFWEISKKWSHKNAIKTIYFEKRGPIFFWNMVLVNREKTLKNSKFFSKNLLCTIFPEKFFSLALSLRRNVFACTISAEKICSLALSLGKFFWPGPCARILPHFGPSTWVRQMSGFY